MLLLLFRTKTTYSVILQKHNLRSFKYALLCTHLSAALTSQNIDFKITVALFQVNTVLKST